MDLCLTLFRTHLYDLARPQTLAVGASRSAICQGLDGWLAFRRAVCVSLTLFQDFCVSSKRGDANEMLSKNLKWILKRSRLTDSLHVV